MRPTRGEASISKESTTACASALTLAKEADTELSIAITTLMYALHLDGSGNPTDPQASSMSCSLVATSLTAQARRTANAHARIVLL